MELNNRFWEERYNESNTPWDIGYISPPIKEVIDGINNKDIRILIPGAGKAYEAIYMHQEGFKNVFVCDWAAVAFEYLKAKTSNFPNDNLIVNDFFKLSGKYDFILEQTFFCAIDPSLREDYVKKSNQLLNEGGILTGLLFSSHFDRQGPPFGGTESEYRKLFEPLFEIERMEVSQNSISPRAGNELFFRMKKK